MIYIYPSLVLLLALVIAWVLRSRRLRAGLAVGACAAVTAATWTPRVLQARQGDRARPGVDATVAAEAHRLGAGTAGLLARVSDQVTYEIYPGVFRGAAATLADGAGNDLDKALLLRDLIRAANPTAALRFATCTLAAAQADRLIADAKTAYRPPVVSADAAASAARQATDQKTRALLQEVAGVWTGLNTQSRIESGTLYTALQSSHAPLKSPSAGDLRAIVASHTWLQEEVDGSWQDLDATLPNAKPGAPLCAAQSTMSDLPAAAYDTVGARVRVERLLKGKLDDRTAVEGTWRTTDLAREPLTMAFAQVVGLQGRVPVVTAPKGTVAYTPVLRAGDQVLAGPPVFVPALSHGVAPGAGVNSALGGVLSAFGGPPPAPAAAPAMPPDTPTVVAAWLQVTVKTPGTTPETTQNEIFDRVGYADRVAGRAATATLSSLDDGHNVYLPFGDVWNVVVAAGTAEAGAGDGKPVDLSAGDIASVARGLGSVQRTYYTIRRAIFAGASGAPAPPIVNARPGVNLLGVEWRAAGTQASPPMPVLVMDVASDHAVPDGAPASSAVQWGVSSLVAERLVTNAEAMLAIVGRGGDVATVPSQDVLAVFAAARQANIARALTRAARDLGPSVPVGARARLAQVFAAGGAALAPTGPVRVAGGDEFGWWVVGPDGSVRDQMQNGRHQGEEGEAVVEEDVAVEDAGSFRCLGILTSVATMVTVAALNFMAAPGPGQFTQDLRTDRAASQLLDDIEKAKKLGKACSIKVG